MVNGIKKIDVARRLDKNIHNRSIDRFNKRIGSRIEMFSKLKTNAKSSLADITARCTRRDKIPLALPDTWWHEEGCRVDTNGREPIWVREKDTEKTVRHVRHYYIEGIKDGYEEFLEWEPYKEYLKNGGRKIKEHMFAKGRCKCMRNRDFRSCVNMIEVQMKNLLEAHVELTKKKNVRSFRKKCDCVACKKKIHKQMSTGNLKDFRHLCLCKKKEHKPYGVPGRLEPPQLYSFKCCVRGDKKCFVHPEVCKQYHSNTTKGAAAELLCTKCGIENIPFCPQMCRDDVKVQVKMYKEVKRENCVFNDEQVEVRMTGKELMDQIKKFAPCYFNNYCELKHDAAVEKANTHRMDDPSFEEDNVVTLIVQADYASCYCMPCHNMKVCTCTNTANLEMICVRYKRQEIAIPERQKTKTEKIKAHKKVVWCNDVWHFWRPSDGTKGANASNHNHAMDYLIEYYVVLLNLPDNARIRVMVTTDGSRGQYAGRKNFGKLGSFPRRHHLIEIVHIIATIFGGKGVWDGLGKAIKNQITKAVARGKFVINLCIEAAIVGAMEALKPLSTPYGPRGAKDTVTPIDDKKPSSADNYMHCFLAKDAKEKASAEGTVAAWRVMYPDKPFTLNIILAMDDTRDYNGIAGSSMNYMFSSRGDKIETLDYRRRACGCLGCFVRNPAKAMGAECECPEMAGPWFTGTIKKKAGGGPNAAAEKRSDEKRRLAWIKKWKKGTILAIDRIGHVTPTHAEMKIRSYNLTHVCGAARKATTNMSETPVHERILKGQYYIMVQDLQVVDEETQTWKKVKGQQKERMPFNIFHEVSDIKMINLGDGILQVHMDNHSELESHWAASLNDVADE